MVLQIMIMIQNHPFVDLRIEITINIMMTLIEKLDL